MPLARDYGAGGRAPPGLTRAKTVVYVAAAVVGVVGIGGLSLIFYRQDVGVARADAKTWTIAGPPCPVISAAAYRGLAIEHPQPFNWEGLRGVRAHGDVSCFVINRYQGRDVADFPVCQFTAPFALQVETPRGAVYYEPGVARATTLSMPNGQVGCVVAANPANF